MTDFSDVTWELDHHLDAPDGVIRFPYCWPELVEGDTVQVVWTDRPDRPLTATCLGLSGGDPLLSVPAPKVANVGTLSTNNRKD